MIKKYIYELGNGFSLAVKKKPNSVFLLSRDEALKILGISKEQDDEMQLKLKNTNSNKIPITEEIIKIRKLQKAIYDYKRRKKLGKR